MVRRGANVIGGSSLRTCREVKDIRELVQGADLVTVFATGPNDYFNYGIHAIEMVQGIVGAGAVSVTHLGHYHADRYLIKYQSGLEVILELESPGRVFYVSVTATNGHFAAEIKSDFYRALLEDIVAHFTNQQPFPADIDLLGQAIEIALAGRESRRSAHTVFLDELRLEEPGFDGHSFNEQYRLSKISA